MPSLSKSAGLLAAMLAFAQVSSATAQLPLEQAILSRDAEELQSALEAGADPNEVFPVFGTSALMLAAIRGNAAMVSLLLDAGADVNWQNANGYSALSAAVRSCEAGWDVAELLLDAGADIENRSGASLTPMMVAIQEERPTFFRGLLERGANVNALNAYGEGALNYAIYYREPEYIGILLDRGADTVPLRRLFQGLFRYYYPNFGQARPHAVDCAE